MERERRWGDHGWFDLTWLPWNSYGLWFFISMFVYQIPLFLVLDLIFD